MTCPKEIREQMGEIKAEMLQYKTTLEAEERTAFTPEEIEQFDSLQNRYDELESEAKTLERLQTFEKPKGDTRNTFCRPERSTQADVGKAFRSWLTVGSPFERSDWNAAAELIGLDTRSKFLGAEYRAQNTTNATGGYFVQDAVSSFVVEALQDEWDWSKYCTIHPTGGGGPLPIPVVNTTGRSASLVSENSTISNQTQAESEQILSAYKYADAIYNISRELVEDASYPVLDIYSRAIGTALGNQVRSVLTTGDGSSKPTGFATDSVENAEVASLDFDSIVDLYMGVPAVYRRSKKCVWQCASSTFGDILKLTDSTGQPLIQPHMNGPVGFTLMGKPVVINDDVPTGAGNDVLFFGDFGQFHVRIVRSLGIRRGEEIKEDAIVLAGSLRFDSKLINAGTNPVQHVALSA